MVVLKIKDHIKITHENKDVDILVDTHVNVGNVVNEIRNEFPVQIYMENVHVDNILQV